MKVSELVENENSNREQVIGTSLEGVRLSEDASTLTIDELEVDFDEVSEGALLQYLQLPKSYLNRCDRDLKVTNINHWLSRNRDVEARFILRDGLEMVTEIDKPYISLGRVTDIIADVFEGDDEVVRFHRDPRRLHVDVQSSRFQIEVPGLGTEERPLVGDVTHGGVRIMATSDNSEAPVVESYLHRLVCSNGLTMPEPSGKIKLRGKTTSEVIAEMEQAAELILGGLDEKLEAYSNLTAEKITGNVHEFIRQLAVERGFGTRIQVELLNRSHYLPENPSMYDVLQIFTRLANEVSYSSMLELQSLGGHIVETNHQMFEHRCTSCQRSLV